MHSTLKYRTLERTLHSSSTKLWLNYCSYRNFSVTANTMVIEETDKSHMSKMKAPVKTKFFTDHLESLSWLRTVAPGFIVDGNKISIIHEPSKFYDTLLEKCKTSTKRITIASLYLGTGRLEQGLVTAIGESLERNPDKLKVKVLLDFTRGSRGKHNSRKMLMPLMEEHEKSCEVSLYHTPALRGFVRNIQRYNELVGLQHMKLYIFDDSLIISGANLSNDYFTNRQDRYVMFEDCPGLANYYDELVSKVSQFSFKLDKDDTVRLQDGWTCHPTDGDLEEFQEMAQRIVEEQVNDTTQHYDVAEGDTIVFPLVQMGQLGVDMDSRVTTRFIEFADPESKIDLATGYFNLTADYVDSIIARSQANFNILMAHPNANGFLGAKGPAGGIPFGYTLIASSFLSRVTSNNQHPRITMHEYQRPGWTFHAKGLWYTLPKNTKPSLTFIGSPNFGMRSVYRDLETQVVVVTKNEKLRQNLLEEKDRLYKLGSLFTLETKKLADRVPALWVHCVVALCRKFF